MEFPNSQQLMLYSQGLEHNINQLLISYYQLSENYRGLVNKNFELQQQLKKAQQELNKSTKQLEKYTSKIISKSTLPEEAPQIEETSKLCEKNEQSSSEKKRFIHRKKKQNVSNQFSCPYPQCSRTYDSSVSLNLHIKLKHNGGTKKQRQTYAKMILEAQEKGEQTPKVDITFPPNFVEDFKNSYDYMKKYSM